MSQFEWVSTPAFEFEVFCKTRVLTPQKCVLVWMVFFVIYSSEMYMHKWYTFTESYKICFHILRPRSSHPLGYHYREHRHSVFLACVTKTCIKGNWKRLKNKSVAFRLLLGDVLQSFNLVLCYKIYEWLDWPLIWVGYVPPKPEEVVLCIFGTPENNVFPCFFFLTAMSTKFAL